MSDNNNDGARVGGYLAAFAIGAALGAGIALLYAPRSGRETRELLAKRASELKEKAQGGIEEAREFVREKKSELHAAVEAGKEAIREERAKHQKAA